MVYRTADSVVALINPHKGNLTSRGERRVVKCVDWVISRPYVFLVLLNLLGVAAGGMARLLLRAGKARNADQGKIVSALVLGLLQLVILGGAVAVSVEVKQVRRAHRVEDCHAGGHRPRDGRIVALLPYMTSRRRVGHQDQRSGAGAGRAGESVA